MLTQSQTIFFSYSQCLLGITIVQFVIDTDILELKLIFPVFIWSNKVDI